MFALLAGVALTACSPLRVSFDVGFVHEGVRETVVEKDPGATGAKIALIQLTGLIADVGKPPSLLGGGPNPVDSLVASLKRAGDDARVRAVVLRVNSPGGTVTGSDIMYREIERFKHKTGKPVVVSMGEVAASGGYYISLAADRILAEPTTTTGSIGVIFQTFNVSEAMKRWGVHARAITSGPNKDMGSPFSPESDEHTALLQHNVDTLYARFRSLVLERRSAIAPERADTITDGRIFTGMEALDLGLVDQVGGVRDAFDAAKKLAAVTSASLVMYHRAGFTPGSPYAVSFGAQPGAPASAVNDQPQGASPASSDFNVLKVNLGLGGALSHLGSGFYYLWLPYGN